ncbi:MAG: alkaline phosphatase family protein [Candidatus Obscuribacterales bacterium]|nr:alkaline phosphatase family protein [Candidatus Obscuribacterales bacterium]
MIIRTYKTALITTLVLFSYLSLLTSFSEAQASEPKVRLVLQVTIDQLRGDLPRRFKNKFAPGGFRYLMDHGTVYSYAHYRHSDTETGPGHASLATGAAPAQHGIIAGEWWDHEKHQPVYSVEDDNYPVLSKSDDRTLGTTSPTLGRAPTNLLSTTIGDEIHIASNGKAKIFAVSGKDRAAILPAGRTGKAFWLSQGELVSSAFYYDKLPDWVLAWNGKKLADTYKERSWELLKGKDFYERLENDDRACEGTYKHLGRTMPKVLFTKKKHQYYKGLEHTFANDELVLSFTKELVEKEEMGADPVTDYLSVSFSGTDYIGHTWGIASLEAEDNLYRVDKVLNELFTYIDSKVGLDNTLVVLSADHGAGEITEYMQSLKFPAHRLEKKALTRRMNDGLRDHFKLSEEVDLVEKFLFPSFYLNLELLAKHSLSREQVEQQLVAQALEEKAVMFAIGRRDILKGNFPSSLPHVAAVINSFQPQRSGDVQLILQQHVVTKGKDWQEKPCTHGSVWTYDTYVPVMVAGPGVPAKVVNKRVAPYDIAPTIAVFLGIKPPSGAIGEPLIEALGD